MSRGDTLARMYGEAVTRVSAAKMLNVSRNTITKLISDGVLRTACDGRRVDVRSIARYIDPNEGGER